MKKITLIAIALFTFALTSCNDLGKTTNSYDCTNRYDVQLDDGSALWVYGASVDDGYIQGTDEQKQKIWVSMAHVTTITKVDCGNGN